MANQKQYEKFVENGIALLDQVNPEWRRAIDVEKIGMDHKTCILGQLYGEYILGWNKLAYPDGNLFGKPVLNAPHTYGFKLTPENRAWPFIENKLLVREWKLQLMLALV